MSPIGRANRKLARRRNAFAEPQSSAAEESREGLV
jgi:hypothetical protein